MSPHPSQSNGGRNHPLAPDPVPLEEARDALQRCIDLIDADGPKGGMWGQTFVSAFRRAQLACTELFGAPEARPAWERLLTWISTGSTR